MDPTSLFGWHPFTAQQALDTGLSYRQWRLVRERLVHIRRNAYVSDWGPDDRIRHKQRVAAELITRTDHFACGASAVCILGLPNPYFRTWDRVPLGIGGPKKRADRGISRSAATPIPTPWGPCTDQLDTAAQIAAELPLPQALMVTDAVARRLAGTEDRFFLASERCRTEVRRKLLEVADLPALRLADPAAESPAESYFRGHLLQAGHSEIRCGVPMKGASGAQYFIDLVLEGLLVEVDGRAKYANLEVLLAEKRREDDLRATGRSLHRTLVEDLYANPRAEVERLRDRRRLALPA